MKSKWWWHRAVAVAVILLGAPPALAATRADKAPRVAKLRALVSPPMLAPDPAIPDPSPDALRIRDWVAFAGDNHALPYLIVDKPSATAWLFDARHRPLARVPVLLGIAAGDEATPGVGAKKLAEIGPAEKTTPAGRFLARYGLAAGRQRVLWVDYTDSVALHPIPSDANKRERRAARMASPTAADNRITFGCINVPGRFYARRVRPLFTRKGGYVYVIPEASPLEAVFPGVRTLPYAAPPPATLEASRP